MAKEQLLLVGDAKNLQGMEVGLKKAGFRVTTAIPGKDAIKKVKISHPDLILADAALSEKDGSELSRVLKAHHGFQSIPLLFVTNERALGFQVKGIELGADAALSTPYIKDLVKRVKVTLHRTAEENLQKRGKSGFAGDLSDMGVVDLVQTFEVGRKTGVVRIQEDRAGYIYFQDGKVVDAEFGPLKGEAAFYRLVSVLEGRFEVVFAPVERSAGITVSTQGLLIEAMRRLDEWARMLEQLPPLNTACKVRSERLATVKGEITDPGTSVLPLLDGTRTLSQVVDDSGLDDLVALGAIINLYSLGLLEEFELKPTTKPAAATEKSDAVAGRNHAAPMQSWLMAPAPGNLAKGPTFTLLPPLSAPTRQRAAYGSADLGPVAEQLASAEPELPIEDWVRRAIRGHAFEPGQSPDEGWQPLGQASPVGTVEGAGEESKAVDELGSDLGWQFGFKSDLQSIKEKFGSESFRLKIALSFAILFLLAVTVLVLTRGSSVRPVPAPSPERSSASETPAPPPALPPETARVPPTNEHSATAQRDPKLADRVPVSGVPEGGHAAEPGPSPSEHDVLLKKGDRASRSRNFKLAAVEFREALALKPDSVDAKLGLGIALVRSDPGLAGYHEAASLLQDGLKVQPDNAEAWLALGMAYQLTEQRARATEAYKKYIVLQPAGRSSNEVRAVLKKMGR